MVFLGRWCLLAMMAEATVAATAFRDLIMPPVVAAFCRGLPADAQDVFDGSSSRT